MRPARQRLHADDSDPSGPPPSAGSAGRARPLPAPRAGRAPESAARRAAAVAGPRRSSAKPLPAALGLVHRHVGLAQQRFSILAVLGIQRRADARARRAGPARPTSKAARNVRSSLRATSAAAASAPRSAAAPRTRRRPAAPPCPTRAARRQAPRHLLQQQVAGWWPSVSLTSLKRSRSRAAARAASLRARRARIGRSQAVPQQRAVGQAGQRVVQRLVRERLLSATTVRDVLDRADHTRGPTGGVADDVATVQRMNVRSVLATSRYSALQEGAPDSTAVSSVVVTRSRSSGCT